VLALVVKNYMDYEYVVGNPPYVNRKHISDADDESYRELYTTPHWHYDLYVLFVERGVDLLTEDGKLSYIISDQFMTRRYGEKLRKHLSENARIEEIVDFGDTSIFEDATNYPCIVTLSNKDTSNSIPAVVVHEPIELPMETVRQAIGSEDHENAEYASFYVDSDDLTEDIWSLIPQQLRTVFQRTRDDNSSLNDISEIISGARIGKDDVFIGEKLSDGSVCQFLPQRAEEPIEVERDLLQPIVKGKDVRRWQGAWKGRYMIYPLENDSVIPEEELESNYPNAYSHFKNYEETLRNRVWFDKGPIELHGEWYAPMYIDPYETYERSTALTPALTDETNFAGNRNGSIFVGGTAGVLGVISNTDIDGDGLLGLLNSTFIGAYLKSSAPTKAGGYYQLNEDLLNTVPIAQPLDDIRVASERAIEMTARQRKISSFPGAYLGDFSGELEYVDYEWQTARRPVEASIETAEDGGFTITAGRTDAIRDPRMDNEARARYVHSAVEGQTVRKGEDVSIPIPRRDADVQALLEELAADRQTVADTDIEALEREIDAIVYDLFELTEEERQVIEDFLEVF
jgi:hypothetical protein